MKLLQLFVSYRLARISLLVNTVLLAVFLSSEVCAQNPSFAGQQFKRVFEDGTIPQGATTAPWLSGVYLSSAGVYIDSQLFINGIFFVDDSGAYTCALQADFSGTSYFHIIGAKPDGSAIICPVAINNPHPCQLYDANGLQAIGSPTPEQGINLGNYFDGRMVYVTASGQEGTKVWYYAEGNPAELWLDNTDVTDLASILDYDGESLAFCSSVTNGYNIWLRESDGTLTRIIGPDDAMPGEESLKYNGGATAATTEVDQGKVYLMGTGVGSSTRVLFSSSDGVTYDIIAKRYDPIPGLGGITINDMNLKQVRDGKIWLLVNQSDGDNVLYQIVNGVWTRVAGQNDSYDGRTAVGFEVFEHAMLGDTVVIAVSFPSSSWPFYTADLYVNGDLPGFSSGGGGGAVMSLVHELDGSWKITAMGEAGATNTLQATSSLTNVLWDTVQTLVADGEGLIEWTMHPTNGLQFFRLVE